MKRRHGVVCEICDMSINGIIPGLFPHSDICEDNYIELYERLDCTGYRLGRVCKSNDFRVYYTFENVGCLLYHTGNPSDQHSLTGFEISYSISDIDECLFPFVCQFGCVNTPGDYVCTCPEGYFLSPDARWCFGKEKY